MIDWPCLFYKWHQQESSIIQFLLVLQKIYPPNYTLQEKELRVWRAMFTACGCTNVTPFSRKESRIEFWSKAPNPTADKEILENLYKNNMIQLNNLIPDQIPDPIPDPSSIQNNTFWNSFQDALFLNKKGNI